MSLADWLKNKWLHKHSTNPEEIRALLRSADEDIRSAKTQGIAAGWRLNMTYTAALRYARAALYASGYRPGREREHERTIDSLAYTVSSISAFEIKLLHKIRRMRHTATYDSVDEVSDTEADAAMRIAVDLRDKVSGWLSENHPELLR